MRIMIMIMWRLLHIYYILNEEKTCAIICNLYEQEIFKKIYYNFFQIQRKYVSILTNFVNRIMDTFCWV